MATRGSSKRSSTSRSRSSTGVDQRDVGVAVADAAARVIEAHVVDAHLCAGDVGGERAQRGRSEVECCRCQQTDTQTAGASERSVARELDRVGHAVEQRARALEQRLTRRGSATRRVIRSTSCTPIRSSS